jgi:phosphoenolpyruvate-protein kinase (PTS system EI component)
MDIFQTLSKPLKGAPLSPGIAMGILNKISLPDIWMIMNDDKALNEQERLKTAIHRVTQKLQETELHAMGNNSPMEAFLFHRQQLQILEDIHFQKMLFSKIAMRELTSEAVCQSFLNGMTSWRLSHPTGSINDRSRFFASLFEDLLRELSKIERVRHVGNEWEHAVYAVENNTGASETSSFLVPCAGLIFDESVSKKETSVCLENFPVPAIQANVAAVLQKLKKNSLVQIDGDTGSIVGTPAVSDDSPMSPKNILTV